jgi:hypothetical protein
MKSSYNAIILIVTGLTVSFLSGNLILSVLTCMVLGALLSGVIRIGGKQKQEKYWFMSDEYVDKIKEIRHSEMSLDEESLNEILEDSIFITQTGHFWSIGTGSHSWHRFDGNNWVKDNPKSKLRHLWRSTLD